MKQKPLFWRIFPATVLLTSIVIILISVFAGATFRKNYYENISNELKARAKLVSGYLQKKLVLGDHQEIGSLCKTWGDISQTHITVLDVSGHVLGDSEKLSHELDNQKDRQEIFLALQGTVAQNIRYSPIYEESFMFVAVPVMADGQVIGVVRTSTSIQRIKQALWKLYYQVLLGCVFLIILVAGFSYFFSRSISFPLEKMKIQAEQFAKGDFSGRIQLQENYPLELNQFGVAMNEIAIQLDQRIQTILNQKNEKDAVLSSMIDGLIAVDLNSKILELNQAAVRLLKVKNGSVKGKSIEEVLRISELQSFIEKSLKSEEPLEEEIILWNLRNIRYIQVHGTPLKNPQGKKLGALIVVNDLTRIRELEGHRRAFVANVSHELKTPLTSIKGFVETLLEGAKDDPKECTRFLEIIQKHSDRLSSIINDLLDLSRLEQGQEVEFQKLKARSILQGAIQMCEAAALKKNIKLKFEGPDELLLSANPSLMEQALVNLINNAIQYSDPHKTITLSASQDGQEVLLQVKDQGFGISEEHLPRLFERFYRVDKARSRHIGGTGLGLSIVKHIAMSHKGRVSVQSWLGKGSAFNIHLPKA